MNYQLHFDQIVNFIKDDILLWNDEILNLIPNQVHLFNEEWVRFLQTLDKKTLWQVDCFQNTDLLPDHPFKTWLLTLKELSIVPKYEARKIEDLPDWAFNKVKSKKRHEILLIADFLKSLNEKIHFAHLVDIGGGVGHLSRVMAHYHNIECISLDINSEFQEIGKKRIEKYPAPKPHKNVTFINHDFTNKLAPQITKEIFTKNSFSLGLHTCGPLALRHMEVASENGTKGLINFGCCYYKMTPETDLNLSSYAKKSGLALSVYSLSLASRGHSSMDYESFLLKRRVKDYRYAIHLLMVNKLGQKTLQSVGEANEKEYWGSFSDYALKRIDSLKIKHNLSASDVDDFYNDPELQNYLDYLYMCNIIRWQYGRALELYLLLDRAMWLEEKGLNTELLEFFDPQLSPRNIALIATRRN